VWASVAHNGFLRQSSSLNDSDQQHDNGKHQQEVNETTSLHTLRDGLVFSDGV